MGQASGKLTISHVDDKNKAEAAPEVDGNISSVVNAAQPVSVKANVSAEPTAHGDHADSFETKAENGPTDVPETQTTSDTEKKETQEKPAKKSKNPLVWIQRRLSKRHSTSKKTHEKTAEEHVVDAEQEPKPEEAAQDPSDSSEATPAQPVESAAADADVQVVETASSLVDQVLSTAMVQQVSEVSTELTPEVAPPAPEVTEHHECAEVAPVPEPADQPAIVTPPAQVCQVEQTIECAATEQSQMHVPLLEEQSAPVAEEQLVNGTDAHVEPELEQPTEEVIVETEKIVEQEESEPVLDSNNTNSECVEQPQEQHEEVEEKAEEEPQQEQQTEEQTSPQAVVESENHVEEHEHTHDHDDVIAAKLSSLELTNGHSENHVTNGVGEAPAEAAVNGN